MQATAQQALKWRWLSPKGIQTVAIASAPGFGRAGAPSPAVHPLDGVHSPPIEHGKGGPCVACRARINGWTNGPGLACGGGAGAVVRRRSSLSRKPTVDSFAFAAAEAAASNTIVVTDQSLRQAVKVDGGTTAPASPGTRSLPHSGQRLTSPHGPPPRGLYPAVSSASMANPSTSGSRSRSGSGQPAALLHPQQSLPNLARAHLRRQPPSAEAVRRIAHAAAAYHTYGGGGADAAAAQLPTRHIVAAVDPDLGGALALIFWDEDPPAAAAATAATVAVPPLAAATASPCALPPPPPPSFSTWHVSDAGGWLLVVPSPAAAVGARAGPAHSRRGAAAAAAGAEGAAAEGAGEEARGESLYGEEGEEGSGGGGGGVASGVGEGELWLPTPPPPPADASRWTVRVWDMPVSAAERQKRTVTGGISRRRLLHVAGARAVLASALAAALPSPEERRRVALYGYVEVPPILPGDGNISAYTCLWSTGAWLGLLTGMGFTVGSTPVRRWKQDLGLYGARSKDAGLALARLLFPDQARILKHKKDHGRADALLIAAWALGAHLPPGLASTMRRNRMTLDELLADQPAVAGLAWGPPRPPMPTDAYGNLLTPERDMWDEIEGVQAKVDRLEEEREARHGGKARKPRAAKSTKATKVAAAVAACSNDDADADGGAATDGDGGSPIGDEAAAVSHTGRKRRKKDVAAAAEPLVPAGSQAAVIVGDGGDGGEEGEGGAAGSSSGKRRRRRTKELELEQAATGAAEGAERPSPRRRAARCVSAVVVEYTDAGGLAAAAVNGGGGGSGSGAAADGVQALAEEAIPDRRRGRRKGAIATVAAANADGQVAAATGDASEEAAGRSATETRRRRRQRGSTDSDSGEQA